MLDGGTHQGAEGCSLGLRPGLGGIPNVVLDPGCPLRCGHTGSLRKDRRGHSTLRSLSHVSGHMEG